MSEKGRDSQVSLVRESIFIKSKVRDFPAAGLHRYRALDPSSRDLHRCVCPEICAVSGRRSGQSGLDLARL
ncbi:hypothetical protein RRG08_038401 [Elysia crispata]|uniref:Uncharacterized protein n=1 Tax=Elysia crispata TaxID=231223 RepID=A0AAE1A9J5_9GAST|nr:hypothetical protein RRG08_038401 [Elysia crispata]